MILQYYFSCSFNTPVVYTQVKPNIISVVLNYFIFNINDTISVSTVPIILQIILFVNPFSKQQSLVVVGKIVLSPTNNYYIFKNIHRRN